ncbi:hypothetical protein [Bacillus piscicola]|nr:hypothetical protein [Bacillus piscicola]
MKNEKKTSWAGYRNKKKKQMKRSKKKRADQKLFLFWVDLSFDRI